MRIAGNNTLIYVMSEVAMHCFVNEELKNKQQGAALVVGLILLLAMSISAAFIMNSSIMDERMSANHRSQTNAFLAAEAGLLKTQRLLEDNWPPADCVAGETISFFNDEVFANDANYTVTGFDCNPSSGITLSSQGLINTLGVRRVITARYEPPSPEGMRPSDAPAAISCLGGGCLIKPGAGQSSVDGRDYDLPTWGAAVAHYRPSDSRLTGDVMPSLFLSDRDESTVLSGSGQFKFCGSERVDCSGDNNILQFYSEDSYPAVDGQATHPTAEQFFDPGSAIGELEPSGANWGTRDNPDISNVTADITGGLSGAGIMVVDGVSVTLGGNVRFEGLVVIRGCGVLNMSGTPIIYGAIIVDSRNCDEDENGVKKEYNPFGSSGTPTVAYSSAALNNANGLLQSSRSGGLSNWAEQIQGL